MLFINSLKYLFIWCIFNEVNNEIYLNTDVLYVCVFLKVIGCHAYEGLVEVAAYDKRLTQSTERYREPREFPRQQTECNS